jgi:hypothetical protein
MKPSLNAHFRIYLPDGERLTEEKIEKSKATACRTIAKLEDIPGGITIEDTATGAALHLGDTLSVLVSAFCLEGLVELVSKGKIHINFFNHDEFVEIELADAQVSLSGDEIAAQSYPAAEYLRAMAACGERYVALMRRVWQGQKERKKEIEDLEKALAAAKRASASVSAPVKGKAAAPKTPATKPRKKA